MFDMRLELEVAREHERETLGSCLNILQLVRPLN